MHVLIVGANGNIGRRLVKQMASGPHKNLTMIHGLRYTIGRHRTVPGDDVATVLLGASSVSHAIAAI